MVRGVASLERRANDELNLARRRRGFRDGAELRRVHEAAGDHVTRETALGAGDGDRRTRDDQILLVAYDTGQCGRAALRHDDAGREHDCEHTERRTE